MTPVWFLEVTETEDSLKCGVTDETSGHDSLSIDLGITDTRLAAIIEQADPNLRELLDLVATRAYKFGYNEGSLDSGVSDGFSVTSHLFGSMMPSGPAFKDACERVLSMTKTQSGEVNEPHDPVVIIIGGIPRI
jgi:hypothetical protein